MLSHDIIDLILSFYPYDKNILSSVLCKPDLIGLRRKFLNDNANKIKRWWRFYTENVIYNGYIIPIQNENKFVTAIKIKEFILKTPMLSKKNYVHDLIFKYEKKYLLSFPEFYIKKIYHVDIHTDSLNSNTLIPEELKNVINKYIINKDRTTYCIYKFLNCKHITFENLLYVGW